MKEFVKDNSTVWYNILPNLKAVVIERFNKIL